MQCISRMSWEQPFGACALHPWYEHGQTRLAMPCRTWMGITGMQTSGMGNHQVARNRANRHVGGSMPSGSKVDFSILRAE